MSCRDELPQENTLTKPPLCILQIFTYIRLRRNFQHAAERYQNARVRTELSRADATYSGVPEIPVAVGVARVTVGRIAGENVGDVVIP